MAETDVATGGLKQPVFSDRCQRCSAQLRIIDDLPLFADVSQSFRGNINESFVVVPRNDPDAFAEVAPSGRSTGRRGNINDSFVVVPDSSDELAKASGNNPHADVRAGPPTSIPEERPEGPQCPTLDQVCRVEKIMALASGQTEQDHPVCGDCLKHVVVEVQRLVDEAQADLKTYQEAQKRLEKRMREYNDDQLETLKADVMDMESEEQALLAKLKVLDREEHELQEKSEKQHQLEVALQRDEEELWRGFAEFQLDLDEAGEERAATAETIRYATLELNRLQRTNVLNDMFHISDQGQYGIINRFRMGRLPEQPVPWEEVNAAWGQACLLLDALVKKCGVPIAPYKLIPRGSFSAIQSKDEILQLYSTDGGLATFFTRRHYDMAMKAFLGCLKEVTKFLQRDPSAKLPFKIEGEKVGGFSVCSMFNPPDRWTKALKFMLSDMKWIIAFVESRDRR